MHLCFKWGILVVVSLMVTACSRVPIASNHMVSFQKKAKSAHHWDVLAADVAAQISQAINSKEITVKKRLSVAAPDSESSFNRAFSNFLINALVNKGLNVTKDKNDSSYISFETQLIRHNSSRYTHIPGSFTLLANGVWVLRNATDYAQYIVPPMALDALMSLYAGPQSHIELVVTSSIYEDNRYVLRRSDIYYVETEDVDLFREFIDLKAKPIEVTNK